MPADSKTDLSLAKAEPISHSGSTSGITELRRGKIAAQQQPERRVRICERNNPADTKISAEGGGGGAPGTRAEIPLQPLEKTMVRQAVSLQPIELMVEQISSCSPWRTPRWSRWMPKGGCDPVGSLRWSRLLAGPVAP
ncbi:epimerase family protein SDR39U1 [Grus japonensis]|uniref:Epimerase family protein SDR39U1 n=1 Tax=Grus japonensis TaxID=30415 RepID=A0ABC9VRT6_GRUJA